MRNFIILVSFISIVASCRQSSKELTSLEIKEDNRKRFFTVCDAKKSGDTIILEFSDTTFGNQGLRITKTKKNFDVKYYEAAVIPDSSYKPPVYTLISKNILFNNEGNEIIEGEVNLKFLAFYSWETTYYDTVNIFGKFQAVLK